MIRLRTRLIAVAAFAIALTLSSMTRPIGRVLAATSALPDPPCNGWTLHTRAPHTLCSEVVVDHLSGLPGMVTIGGLAFDSAGALYVTRLALGQVIRLTPHSADNGDTFDPPEVVADGLTLPSGIVCAGVMCDVATDTAIYEIGHSAPVIDHLSSDGLRPLAISADGSLLTTNNGQIVRVAPQSGTAHVVSSVSTPVAGVAQTADGALWITDGRQSSYALHALPTLLEPDSAPYAIVVYPDRADVAFPDLRGNLLITTAGSWNALAISGYELWTIPVMTSHTPGIPHLIIPSDTIEAGSDASVESLTFYPDHPIALAVDPRGWIYLATREGRIVRLRPRVG